jgi:thiol-disulfide isomerase/thioredoxin
MAKRTPVEYYSRVNTVRLDEIRSWTEGAPLALLVTTTPDCGVCDAIKPKLRELAERHSALELRFVDIAENPEIGGQLGIFVVPVLILYAGGQETLRLARYFSMDELESRIERLESLLDS